jgi:diguanylate cyclase (GGDEF)-like protein
MSAPVGQRRLLLAVGGEQEAFRQLFQTAWLQQWQVVEASTLERARFMLQLDPCDVLLLDAGLYRRSAGEDLTWLSGQQRIPVLFLADGDPETVARVLEEGADYWMPREVALRHPRVLAVMLQQAAEFAELLRHGQETAEALNDCRRQVGRLVSLLWEAVPGDGRARWFSQRHMLERLEEEVARAQRHGCPLTVVLGEVEGSQHSRATAGERQQLTTWTADQIHQIKRRSDVAGQYGLQGFMMVLPQTTPEGAAGCCRRLRTILESPEGGSGPLGPAQVYFGVASFSSDASSMKSLLSRAEEDLERARRCPSEDAQS